MRSLVGLVMLGALLLSGRSWGQDAPPNIVVFLADDLTYRDIGCYGGPARTPNLDQLAVEGMRFTSCFQAAPMCSPTRHCLYTGLYPVRSGAYPNHAFARPGTKSIVHALQPAGYRVALSGKRHVEPEEVFPFEYSGSGSQPDEDAIEQLMLESRESGTPFCLFVCYSEPHDPWTKGDASPYPPDSLELPPYFVDTPETRLAYSQYLAEVTHFDWRVGQTLWLLKKHRLAENTLVVALSEQGSSLPFGKWTLYDTGIQSACIVRWPGKVRPGAVSDALVEYVDFVPTLLAAAGIPSAALGRLDGRSFLPVLLGQRSEHKEHVFALMTTRGIYRGSDYFGIRSVRSQCFKYIVNLTPERTFKNPVPASPVFQSWVNEAWLENADALDKVQRYTHRPPEELYDLECDPYEWTNLAAEPALAGVKTELRAELERWMAEQGDKGQATEMEALEHSAKSLAQDD